jgi:general secretion pathway protein D
MRTTAFFILGLFYSILSFAADFSIKTVNLEDKVAYTLDAGAFPHESNALQLKFKLSSLFKQPVSIEYSAERKLYIVTIGPIDDIKVAQTIQHKMKTSPSLDNLPKKSSNIVSSNKMDSSNNADMSGKKLWNLRNADIRAVIAEVSRITGINFVIDPRVQGKISIVSSTPMSNNELYQVFLSILQVSGYAAVPNGEITKIIPNIDAKTVTADSLNELKHAPEGDDMLVEVVPVQYVPAEQLVPVLRPLMPQWSSVSAYAPSNMLILSGRANNIKRLADIIKQVDSSSSSGIDIVPLRHALAMDVANTLKDLVKTQGNAGARSQAMLAADDRSNAILLSGSRTERIRLRLLIE